MGARRTRRSSSRLPKQRTRACWRGVLLDSLCDAQPIVSHRFNRSIVSRCPTTTARTRMVLAKYCLFGGRSEQEHPRACGRQKLVCNQILRQRDKGFLGPVSGRGSIDSTARNADHLVALPMATARGAGQPICTTTGAGLVRSRAPATVTRTTPPGTARPGAGVHFRRGRMPRRMPPRESSCSTKVRLDRGMRLSREVLQGLSEYRWTCERWLTR